MSRALSLAIKALVVAGVTLALWPRHADRAAVTETPATTREPAPVAAKAAASPTRTETPVAPTTSTSTSTSPAGAPNAAKGPGGDPLPPGPFGETLGTIPMQLVPGLTDVDAQPETLGDPLSPAPSAGVDTTLLPAGSWLFGAAPVTRTQSVAFAVLADRSALVFDSNRDGKLEPSERHASDGLVGGLAWFPVHAVVRQEAADGIHEADLPMRVGVALSAPMARSRLDAYRAGTFRGKTRPVRIALADRTFRGWFTHPGRDALLVDVNGDGRFDAAADSTERYRLGEPFPLDGLDAVVMEVGPLGETLTLAKSPKPARRIASLAAGAPAPAFEAHSLDGRTWTPAALKGKWVVLDFWATWCGPCRAELPNLMKLHAEHPDVVILGVSADRARPPLDAFVAAQKMDWPQILDDNGAMQRTFRVATLPTSFVLDPDGRFAARDLRGPEASARLTTLIAARR